MTLEALFAQAARQAAEYRRTVGDATAPLPYAAMRAAFDAPTPEHGTPAAGGHRGPGDAQCARIARDDRAALLRLGDRRITSGRRGCRLADQPPGDRTPATTKPRRPRRRPRRWRRSGCSICSTCHASASVGFVTGATVANFVCLAAARGAVLRRVGWNVEANGLFGAPPIHVLIGDDAHTSVFSALQFLGLGHDRVVRIATDAQGRMQSAEFARAIGACDGPTIVDRAGRPAQHRRVRSDRATSCPTRTGAWCLGACRWCVRPVGARLSVRPRIWRRDSRRRIPGRPTGTSGCRRHTIAATPSCATPRRIAAR